MKELAEHKINFKKILEEFLNQIKVTNLGEEELLKAMLYSIFAGEAKYIRSFIVLEVAKMLNNGVYLKEAEIIAIAIELVHTYSLIHDDMPCMDNSDFRRGKPSLHKQFSESTALLTGNAILTFAFEELCKLNNIDLILALCKYSGFNGIMSGQVLDLNPNYKKEEFEIMNYHKTGKLLEACCVLPAIFLNQATQNLANYGKSIGVAYQMQDDLLDEGEESLSYLSFYSKQELQNLIQKEILSAQSLVKSFKYNNILTSLPLVLASRTN